MSLPNLTIPFELPLDIPVLIHPAVVHFVVAIPIVILLLELINLFFKKRAISILSLFLIFIVVLSMGVAYFAGVVDGKEAYSLLIADGQAELKEHKLLGIYLVYASVALLVLKLLFMAFSQVIARLFFILLLIGFISVTLKQGKDGGELVYKYGANNQAVSSIKEKLEELQDEYNELEEESKEAKDSEDNEKSDDNETAIKLKELQEKYDALLLKNSEKPTASESKVETSTETPKVEEVVKVEEKKEEEEPKVETSVEVETKEASTSTVSLEIPSDTNKSH
ncbi:ORF 73 ECLF1 [hydrothermal vent metagenome]|uniref:ORF 73 ECLF1 n=1 Tax=hydrothermal vent metagenome TaxID=652676 RepID=A0A1W1CMV0_9ZZZZ